MHTLRRFFLAAALTALTAGAVAAGSYPRLEAALSLWEGPKRAVLRSDLPDPLSSPLVQDLLELFLALGYEVRAAPLEEAPREGLLLDLRGPATSTTLILSRAADEAVLAVERSTGGIAAKHAPAEAAPAPAPGPRPGAAWELEEPFRRFAYLGESPGGPRLALLYDDRLELAELSPSGLRPLGRFRVPASPSRGLHVDAADLDADGSPEVAALWAQDVHSVYQGVDSGLRSWLFTVSDEAVVPATPDLAAHLRVAGGNAFVQDRGPFALYNGPVFRLGSDRGRYTRGIEATPWGGAGLFGFTPLDGAEGLAWRERGSLALVSRETGRPVPGGALLGELGTFRGPEVAVRLRNPEYRTGFGLGGQVAEAYHPLPPRVAVVPGGEAYTIHRGRTPGVPLVGQPSGRDAVVRIVREEGAPRLERPFEPVEAFVVDFALRQQGQGPASVLLLVNEREDGSGKARLLEWGERRDR